MKVTRRNNDDAAVAVTAVTEAGEDAAIKSIAEKSIARAARVADELQPSRAVVSIDTIIPKTPPTARCSVEGALVEVPDDDDETDDASPSAKRKRDAMPEVEVEGPTASGGKRHQLKMSGRERLRADEDRFEALINEYKVQSGTR